jgi:hypothetical protein
MTTATTASGIYLGTCAWAGHRFRSMIKPVAKLTVCPECAPVTVESYGRDWTQHSMVKWAGLRIKVSNRRCSEVCTSAKSDLCACACGGENHGASLGLAF